MTSCWLPSSSFYLGSFKYKSFNKLEDKPVIIYQNEQKKNPTPHLAFHEGRAVQPQVNKICVQIQNFRFREVNVASRYNFEVQGCFKGNVAV